MTKKLVISKIQYNNYRYKKIYTNLINKLTLKGLNLSLTIIQYFLKNYSVNKIKLTQKPSLIKKNKN